MAREVEQYKYYTIPEMKARYLAKQSTVPVTITDSDKGFILKSPDGTRRRFTVNNNGILTGDII